MSYEHRNGYGCEDVEDRVDDLERELGAAYRSLARIHTWLGNVIAESSPPANLQTGYALHPLVEDAYNEAREKVEL